MEEAWRGRSVSGPMGKEPPGREEAWRGRSVYGPMRIGPPGVIDMKAEPEILMTRNLNTTHKKNKEQTNRKQTKLRIDIMKNLIKKKKNKEDERDPIISQVIEVSPMTIFLCMDFEKSNAKHGNNHRNVTSELGLRELHTYKG